MSNKLVKISKEDLPYLRDLYKIDWPKNIVSYFTLENYIRWYEQENEIENFEIFCLNGDWSDGTYLFRDGKELLFNTLNKDLERLRTILLIYKVTDECVFSIYYQRFYDLLQDVVKTKGLKIDQDLHDVLYYLPKEDALKFNPIPPSGIIFKQLEERHAYITDEVWPHRYPGSLEYFLRLSRMNPSIGAFTQDGNLVGWCYRTHYGGLGVLQVRETFRRKGLGSLIVQKYSQKFAEMGYDIFGAVVADNFPSRKMFLKLGFKEVDDVHWLFFSK